MRATYVPARELERELVVVVILAQLGGQDAVVRIVRLLLQAAVEQHPDHLAVLLAHKLEPDDLLKRIEIVLFREHGGHIVRRAEVIC